MEQIYQVIRTERKTAAISVKRDLTVVLRLPLKFPEEKVEALVHRHQDWIAGAVARQREYNQVAQDNNLSPHQIDQLKRRARGFLPERTAYYAYIMGVTPLGIKITSAQKRWGSCSSKNSLCFSYIVMLLPPRAIDYVVIHELAHITHKNHSKEFYSLIEKYLPDYRELQEQIKAFQNKGLPYLPEPEENFCH